MEFFDPSKRVFSGVSAIIDYEIINFRDFDCSKQTKLPNCRIVELFLTTDTSRKMENGVNIDVSIDRYELGSITYALFLLNSKIIFRGMDILKNDVSAILRQIFNLNLYQNKRHSTMAPGTDLPTYNFLVWDWAPVSAGVDRNWDKYLGLVSEIQKLLL